MKRAIWRVIWFYGLVFHIVATPLMYRAWWFIAYRWVYPYMIKAKQEGKEFAQPYGEGVEAVFNYIRQ